MRVILLSIALLSIGCAGDHQSVPVVAASSVVREDSRFTEESQRALACLDGLSRLELSSDQIFMPQKAHCTERVSYARQIMKPKTEQDRGDALSELMMQIDACHGAAELSNPRFKKCIAEETKLRERLKSN
jgi:hypothetical protein